MNRLFLLAAIALASAHPASAEAKPKYGPNAVPLTTRNESLRAQPSPDFWAMMPFYQAQGTGSSCSLASLTMVVNAIRKSATLTSDDELATEKEVLKRAKHKLWEKAVGPKGGGVTLDELSKVARAALDGYGLKDWKVELVRFDSSESRELKRLRDLLKSNEASGDDFVVLNFLQGTITGDADVGHIAPVAAYDAKSDSVLILDPDRSWYEPYWAPVSVALEAMLTKDNASGKTRGLIRIYR